MNYIQLDNFESYYLQLKGACFNIPEENQELFVSLGELPVAFTLKSVVTFVTVLVTIMGLAFEVAVVVEVGLGLGLLSGADFPNP